MTFEMADGSCIERRPVAARGQPPDRLAFADVVEKYEDCLGTVVPRPRIEASLSILADLETVPDVGALIETVRP
jgi:hypothetical protein